MATHTYRTDLSWSGATDDYETYSRAHDVSMSGTDVKISADVAFRGDPALPNPEQLVVAAASSCQLLSFLAVAARSKVRVVSYTDTAEGIMPESERPIRITSIVLRPHVVVEGTTIERVERLLEKAHRECYIANSLTTEVTLEPTIEVR